MHRINSLPMPWAGAQSVYVHHRPGMKSRVGRRIYVIQQIVIGNRYQELKMKTVSIYTFNVEQLNQGK